MNQEPETTRLYRLETAASMTGMSTSRVRTYVKWGFVRPARVEGRRPLFGESELAQLRQVRRLADDLGLNLAGIEVTLNLLNEVARLRGLVAARRQVIRGSRSDSRETELFGR